MTKPRLFFTSDTHFGHANIIRYCSRPFKDVVQMEAVMVERWNARVSRDDTVFFLGDFAFARPSEAVRLARLLNGQKHLIFGNHDNKVRRNGEFLGCWLSGQEERVLVERGGLSLLLSHHPLADVPRGAVNLHGHCHGSRPDSLPGAAKTHLDVGVDVWDFRPVALSDVLGCLFR